MAPGSVFGRSAHARCGGPGARRAPLGLAALIAALAGCGPEEPAGDAGGGPDAGAEPPWPAPPEPPAPCTPAMDLADPAVAAPQGDVGIEPSARLEPVGVDVHVALEVRAAGSEEVDTDVSGPIDLALDPPGEVVAVGDVTEGVAEATVRLGAPGLVRLSATFEDGRTGTAEVLAYEPRLPVLELAMAPADFGALLASRYDGERWPVTLREGGREASGRVRLHGGSSREFPKKSFHVDLDAPLEDGTRTVILRAEWNDGSLLRNWLAHRFLGETTWLPTPDATLVHLRVNGALYGLMVRVEAVDDVFAARRGVSVAASVFAADPPQAWVPPGASFVPLGDRAGYPAVYRRRLGLGDHDDVVALIEEVLQAPDDEIAGRLAEVLDVDDALVFFAAMAVLQNHDHIRKNYFLARDSWAGDGRFELWPWDLDLTLGHLWTEEADVLDERIFTDESPTFGARVPEHEFYNQLLTRLLAVPAWRARFAAFVHRIADAGLAPGVIDGWIDEALCAATPEILADARKRAANDEVRARIDEIRAFVAARRDFLADWEAP